MKAKEGTMPSNDLAFTPASELRHLIDSKQVSIVEITEMFLRRIEDLNPKLNAYLTVTGDEALASARASEDELLRGESRGPLHGIPISIKDLEITKGSPVAPCMAYPSR
jgi:Asp-tRNA(Asn)/Glu-tRNA(Gln) amidotransferase A subunit family amidase